MARYGIPSYGAFVSTWSRAQLYLAIDAMFWNAPAKERAKYGPAPVTIDVSQVRSRDFFANMGFSS